MIAHFTKFLQSWLLGPKYGTNFEDLCEPALLIAESAPLTEETRWLPFRAYRPIEYPAIDPPADIGTTDRLSILRAHAPKSAKILEIGPSFNPVAAKRDGYNAYSVDKARRSELIESFYGPDREGLSKIEDVDFVWSAPDLLESIPEIHHGSFDVVIASHVLEHLPNPIKFLQSLQNLLKPEGYVTLALPDKRFCFDFFRPLTTTGAWLEAYDRDDHVHSRRTLFEYFSTVVAQDLAIAWDKRAMDIEAATFSGRSLQDAYVEFSAARGFAGDPYKDCHAWVFTPSSLSLLLNEVHAIGLIGFVPEFISSTANTEFFAHLRLASRRPINAHERLQLLALMAREQQEGFKGVAPARKRTVRPILRKLLASRLK